MKRKMIMKHFHIAKAVVLLLSLSGALQRDYTEIYSKDCTPQVLADLSVSVDDRLAQRSSSSKIYVSAAAIINVVNGKGVGKLMSEGGVYPILMIILTIFCLISLIVFLVFCCCCDRAAGASSMKAKVYTLATFLFIFVSIALFIALFVFIGKLNGGSKSASCGIASIPHDLLDGVQTANLTFLGFRNLTTLLTNFQTEVSNLSSVSSDFDAIANKNLPASTQAAYNSLNPFYTKYKDSTTTDGQGQKTRPLTVSGLTTGVNAAIDAEFSIYNQVAIKINDAASIGRSIGNNSQMQTMQANLQTIIDQMNSISSQINNNVGGAATGVDYFNRYAPIGYWITLGLGLVLVLLALASVVVLVCLQKTHTNRCRCGAKFCLAFNGLLIVLLGIVAVVLIVASLGLGSVCHALGNLLSANDVAAEVATYGVSLDPFVSKIINQCLPPNASGDLSALLDTGRDVFNQTQGFLDGLTTFDSMRANITASANGSFTVAQTVAAWSNFKVSIYPDQLNAVATLSSLNDAIKCSNTQYQLNAFNCTGGAASASCAGVYNSANFQAPSCSSNAAQASSLFATLKTFTNDEDALLGSMISDLSGSASTPGGLFQTARDAINSVLTNIDNVRAKMQNTLSIASTLQNGLSQSVDCRVVRLELNNLEAVFCFKFNKNLYYFAALLAFVVFFLFIFSWTLCCALRYIPSPGVADGEDKVRDDATVFVNEEEARPYA